MHKYLFVFGTRPEAIKMAPLIKAMKEDAESFDFRVCVTGQHHTMLDQVLAFFGITPDFDLKLMKKDQTLFDITAGCIQGIQLIIKNQYQPDFIIVQGDTTTAFIGALAGFYAKCKVIHLEAGLRSHNKFSPFPEEMNRVLISRVADLHFAPTDLAMQNLIKEGVPTDKIWNVGNTVIDALLQGVNKLKEGNGINGFEFLNNTKRLILVTGHRRENFGEPFEDMCKALKAIADENEDVEIVYPVHLNPNVQEPVKRILAKQDRIHLIEPVDYQSIIILLNRCFLVLTDSGGIQEEAPALGKPVLVMRDVTERTEGVSAGTAKLVGTNSENIIKAVQELLDNKNAYFEMAQAVNPYGDGQASDRIIKILKSVC